MRSYSRAQFWPAARGRHPRTRRARSGSDRSLSGSVCRGVALMSTALLEIRQLRAGYGEAEVLHGIELSVGKGEFVCIIGANTAGKSTLLRAISRLVPRSSGIMRFDAVDLMALAAHEIPALGIAHVPEGRQIFPEMTVEENLLLGAFTARKASALPARIEDVFGLFPRLRERYGQLAGTLSGGEQQMVAVGRALM